MNILQMPKSFLIRLVLKKRISSPGSSGPGNPSGVLPAGAGSSAPRVSTWDIQNRTQAYNFFSPHDLKAKLVPDGFTMQDWITIWGQHLSLQSGASWTQASLASALEVGYREDMTRRKSEKKGRGVERGSTKELEEVAQAVDSQQRNGDPQCGAGTIKLRDFPSCALPRAHTHLHSPHAPTHTHSHGRSSGRTASASPRSTLKVPK